MNKGTIIHADFAKLNKNNTIEEYELEISTGEQAYNRVKCKVEAYHKVSNEKYDELTHSFLENSEFYVDGNGKGHGGSEYTGTKYPEMKEADFDISIAYRNPEMMEDFRANNITLVVLIENEMTGEMVAVNPEGYGYARYVGINVNVELPKPEVLMAWPSFEDPLVSLVKMPEGFFELREKYDNVRTTKFDADDMLEAGKQYGQTIMMMLDEEGSL